MMRRVPLWLTLLPLALAFLAYWLAWRGWRDDFRAQLDTMLGPAAVTAIGGFPYRLEATLAPFALGGGDGPAAWRLEASDARINRQPWRPQPLVAAMRAPRLTARLGDPAGVLFAIEARASLSSLSRSDDRIARLSQVFEAADMTVPLISTPVTAERFELHLREILAAPGAPASATPPEQAQLVVSGSGVRLGRGDPLSIEATLGITAQAPLGRYAEWREGGTVEVRRLTLGDPTGEVLALSATAAPVGAALVATGTVETVCPFTLAAAWQGRAAPAERRQRRPVSIAFSRDRLDALDPALARRPVLRQAPACPKLG